jgi:hypothetical protein
MQTPEGAVNYLGFLLGSICAVVGFTVQGLESGVFWSLVGYFLGKAIQSVLWTITGEPAT